MQQNDCIKGIFVLLFLIISSSEQPLDNNDKICIVLFSKDQDRMMAVLPAVVTSNSFKN